MTDAFRAYHKPTGKAAKTLNAYRIGERYAGARRLETPDRSASPPRTTSRPRRGIPSGPRHPPTPPRRPTSPRSAPRRRLEGEFRTDLGTTLNSFACSPRSSPLPCGAWWARGTAFGRTCSAPCCWACSGSRRCSSGTTPGTGAITHNHAKDFFIGQEAGNLCNGVGITWWTTTHNVHHCACNSLECDPDIQHMPVLAVTPKYFDSVWSLYHQRRMAFDRMARFLVSVQHYSFYPIRRAVQPVRHGFILLLTGKGDQEQEARAGDLRHGPLFHLARRSGVCAAGE